MTVKFYHDNLTTIYCGDCRRMTELADESVQCVVTSPPYWGLRKYEGNQDLIWGGDKDCEHEWAIEIVKRGHHAGETNPGKEYYTKDTGQWSNSQGCFCLKCGAWKGAFGLEPTPEMYVQHTVEILREIRRVLRKDGVVFWNIGDSYAGSGGAHKENHANPGISQLFNRQGVPHYGDIGMPERYLAPKGLKPKDLCLIPFRIAIAAQEDGWWVRSVIIWNKPNPMPESVNGWRWERHRIKVGNEPPRTQAGKIEGSKWAECPGCEKCSLNGGYVLRKGSWRPTNSYEQILMLTKSGEYYCDADAVRERSTCVSFGADQQDTSITHGVGSGNSGLNAAKKRARDNGTFGSRNLRDVWTFPTRPCPEAHFAVFPEKLPETCIKAATSEKGCCPKCGAPWARVLDKKPSQFNIRVRDAKVGRATPEEGYKPTEEEIDQYPGNPPDMRERRTIGWRPTCHCEQSEAIPCTVLDPFCGTGTTLWVAKKLGMRAIGYDTAEAYCQLAVDRNRQMTMELTK